MKITFKTNKSTSSSIKLLFLFISFLWTATLLAQSFFSPLTISETDNSSSRQMALGFTSWGAANSISALQNNPALLNLDQGWIKLNMSLTGKNIKESRSFPVQDSFDDFLADNTYVVNQNMYYDYDFGVIVKPLANLDLGVSFSPFHSFDFEYEEEVRGSVFGEYNRDPLVGYNRLKNQGKLYNYSVGAAFHILDNLSVGGSINLVSGSTIKDMYEIEVIRESEKLASDTTISFGGDVDTDHSTVFNLGTKYDLTPQLAFSISYRSPYKINYKNSHFIFSYDSTETLPVMQNDELNLITDSEYNYRESIQFGFSYRPQNIIPTTIFVDFVYENWEDFSISNRGKNMEGQTFNSEVKFDFNNIIKTKIGIEHNLFSGFPVRLGFFHDPSPINSDLTRNWFTFGTCYKIGDISFDLSGAFTKSVYQYDDLFIIEAEKRLAYDTVRENLLTGKINLTYTFE